MKISVIYNKKTNEIKLLLDDDSLYEELLLELEEFKESLNSDIEVDLIIDEANKTIVSKSKFTDNTFRDYYKNLDVNEICYCVHEVAEMDDAVIYIEEFSTMEPITIPYDEDSEDSDGE